jgi:hypothetical protein
VPKPTQNPVFLAATRVARASRPGCRGSDPEDLAAARRALTEAKLERAIREAVAAAPPLTQEQRDKLALILVRGSGGAASANEKAARR